jgi:hypothetical protein
MARQGVIKESIIDALQKKKGGSSSIIRQRSKGKQ